MPKRDGSRNAAAHRHLVKNIFVGNQDFAATDSSVRDADVRTIVEAAAVARQRAFPVQRRPHHELGFEVEGLASDFVGAIRRKRLDTQ